MQFVVATFYKIFDLSDADAKISQEEIRTIMQQNNIKGTVLLGAHEGINGTISGAREDVNKFYNFTQNIKAVGELDFKESLCDFNPFDKIKVKVKKEIVTMRAEGFDFLGKKGSYVDPDQWDALIAQDDVILIDSRNDYEYHVGTFENAINPDIENFRDFPAWLEKNKELYKDKKIATFCTGGIRCEKLTAYMAQNLEGAQVYHLNGGILGYFLKNGNKNKKWKGHCFVFDNRIAVDDNMKPV